MLFYAALLNAGGVKLRMSKRHNDQRDRALRELVTTYEDSLRRGQQLFLEQEQFDDLLSYYYGQEDFETALTVADLAVDRYRFTPDFYKWKALLHKILAQESDALDALDQLATYAPFDYEVQLLRLEVLVHFEHRDRSRELLDELLAQSETDAQFSLMAYYDAVLLTQEGQYGKAFEALCDALRRDPWQEIAYEELCHEPAFLTFYPKLVRLLKELSDQHPFNEMLWYYQGVIFDQLGDDEQALEAFDFARVLDDQHPDYIIDYADKLFDLEQYERALQFYVHYHKLAEAEESYETFIRMGRCHQMLEDLELALKAFHRAVDLSPASYEGYQHLGECYALREHWGQAAYYYGQAVRQTGYPPSCWLGLACCKAAISEQEEAEAAFIQAIERAPEYSDAYITYALFLIDLGRERDALQLIDDARQDYFDGALAYGSVAVHLLCNRRRQALLLLTEALSSFYDEHHLLFDWSPELEEDNEVQSLISSWS